MTDRMNGYHAARIKVLRNKRLTDFRERRGYARGYYEAMTTIMERCREEFGDSDNVDLLHLYASSCLTGVADAIDLLSGMDSLLSSGSLPQKSASTRSHGESPEEVENEIVKAGQGISQRNCNGNE